MLLRVIVVVTSIVTHSQSRKLEFQNDLFDFKCPVGFIQDQKECLLNASATCPSISELNTTYTIVPKAYLLPRTPYLNRANYCSYHRDEFISLGYDAVSLNFSFNTSVRPFALVLEAQTKFPIDNLMNKINCVTFRRISTIRNVKIEEVYTDGKNTTRYMLVMNGSLSRYACFFSDPGKSQLTFSSRLVASTTAKNVFQTQVPQNCWKYLSGAEDFYTFLWNATHYGVYGQSNADDISMAVNEFKTKLTNLCNVEISNITHTEYCLPSTTNNSKKVQWILTEGGKTAVSEDVCFGFKNRPSSTRNCIKAKLAYWDNPQDHCNDLTILDDIPERLMYNNSMNENDYDFMVNILNTAVSVPEVTHSTFFSVINALLNANAYGINFQKVIQLKENISKLIDIFIQNQSKRGSFINVDFPNIAVDTYPLFNELTATEESALIAEYRDNRSHELTAQLKFSTELLNSFNISEDDKIGTTIFAIMYNTNQLHPGQTHNTEKKILHVGVHPKIKAFDALQKPLIVSFATESVNAVCAVWDEGKKKWSSFGITTRQVENGVECKSLVFGKFSLFTPCISSTKGSKRFFKEKCVQPNNQVFHFEYM